VLFVTVTFAGGRSRSSRRAAAVLDPSPVHAVFPLIVASTSVTVL
jgi:hypothetical protein